MGANPKGWIVDGDYTLRTSGLVDENATDVVCRLHFYHSLTLILTDELPV